MDGFLLMPSNNNLKKTDADEKTEYEIQLEDQIQNLREALEKSKKDELSAEDISRLSKLEEEQAYLNQENKTGVIDRIYKKKGIVHYWAVKVPAKVLNVGSIADSQKVLNDNFRALTSPICPACEKGILMYDTKKHPVNGQVIWFCGNPSCNYQVWSTPSVAGVFNSDLNNKIKSINKHQIWREKWEKLSESDKAELIDSHLESAILYRNFTLLIAVILIIETVFKFWYAVGPTFLMVIASLLVSFKWAYFAWRIKTGDVGFIDWLKNCKAFYSVDWVDSPDSDSAE